MPNILSKDNVLLKPISIEDTDNIIKWRNDDVVKENVFTRTDITRENHLLWLENKVNTGKCIQFIIRILDKNADIGTVFIKNIDHNNKKGEFGIFIGLEDFRGKGYGKIATELILQYIFKHSDLNRIYLQVLEDNIGAIKSYSNAGFVREGVLRQDFKYNEKYFNVVVMSILKKDWMEMRL